MSEPGVTRYTPLINGEMMRIADGEYNKYDDTVTALTRLRQRCAMAANRFIPDAETRRSVTAAILTVPLEE